jgi:TFIIF-interacting CTD phosphatase-like protein
MIFQNKIILKTLIILDLDHTLIYGSYAETETAVYLFQYNQYLKVYKRPLVDELIQLCRTKGDIVVFTTALKSYAFRICNKLNVEPVELLTRRNCVNSYGNWKKQVKKGWISKYDRIIIIDDSPNVWMDFNEKVVFLIPNEFRGCKNDKGLIKIINEIKRY